MVFRSSYKNNASFFVTGFNLIESNSFKIDLFNLSYDFDYTFHYNGFLVDVEIPINKMQSFLEKHWDLFEKLAAEFVKKIQNC